MAWIEATEIDEELIKRRRVVRVEPDEPGLGYYARLSCGHIVWMPSRPLSLVYCATCLQTVKKQIERIQAHQEMIR